MLSWTIFRYVILIALLAVLVAARRFLKPFFWRITFCLVPLVVGAWIVSIATARYETEGTGFKLGVDLVGGTILVYEVDADKMTEDQKRTFKPDELAARLKRRLDPNDLYNITIRPVNTGKAENTRVEIILPTGGRHQEAIENRDWETLLGAAKDKFEGLDDAKLQAIPRGNRQELIEALRKQGKKKDDGSSLSVDDAENFVTEHYKSGKEKKDVTAEQIQTIKNQIRQVGALEFRILANDKDDKEAIDAANAYFKNLGQGDKDNLVALAEKGLPPPGPKPASGGDYFSLPDDKGEHAYTWVEMGKYERWQLGLNNDADDPWKNLLAHVSQKWSNLRPADFEGIAPDDDTALMRVIVDKGKAKQQEANDLIRRYKGDTGRWKQVAQAREKNEPLLLTAPHSGTSGADNGTSDYLIYSRPCLSTRLTAQERAEKKFEYFLLTRDPERVQESGREPYFKKIIGDNLTAFSDHDERQNPAIGFQFDTAGANLFYDVTSKNTPTGPAGSKFFRHLAILLDNVIISAPSLNNAIRNRGIISGDFTLEEVNEFVRLLRSGALPATLKPIPVSENTLGATLGEDTIWKGTLSVGIAFVAILVFMLVYYRFAGVVACVALLANLLLTVAFMVLVSATFTLPGLAGLVLMLGMAVDANVLIYERLREERDRGASLALSIRNGYDRAFPTIIDTHLSSIFTAVVLYVVGNDQLKGFGISLAAGLFISLFTSLYMTRLMFDLWLNRGWLRKLSMLRLFTRPNINFMAIRYYWFAATIILTIFGITVFILRLPEDLNIDFNGGTAYGGQTVEARTINDLRGLLSEKSQAEKLKVQNVEELVVAGEEGYAYAITYVNGPERTIHFPNKPEGATPEERKADVKHRAEQLPDVAVEMIFPSSDTVGGNKSRYFNVRTTEKAPELVQASIARLLGDDLKRTKMTFTDAEKGVLGATLEFTDPQTDQKAFASPSQVSSLLRRECLKQKFPEDFTLTTAGDQNPASRGQFNRMKVTWNLNAFGGEKETDLKARRDKILAAVQEEFKERPIPDRLENFDAQLAKETRNQAMYAVLASWAAILLFLWFRFGSWTFGTAAVLCLIHDLFFTLGIIAFCHYLHQWVPGLASFLLLEDFKIDLPAVAALLTLVGYSVSDTIVVFDRIREVRGKNPELTAQTINDSVNQTLSRTLLTALSVFLVVFVLYVFGGEGIHLFAFVMVVGVIVGTYSSIYIASPLLLIFGEGAKKPGARGQRERTPAGAVV